MRAWKVLGAVNQHFASEELPKATSSGGELSQVILRARRHQASHFFLRGATGHLIDRIRRALDITARRTGEQIRRRAKLSKMRLILREVQVSPEKLQGAFSHQRRKILSREEGRQDPHLAHLGDRRLPSMPYKCNLPVAERETSLRGICRGYIIRRALH